MQQRILLGCSSPIDRGSGILAFTRELITGLVAGGAQVHVAAPPPADRSWATDMGIELFDTPSWGEQAKTVQKLVRYMVDCNITGVINSDNSCVQSCAPALRVPMISIGHMSKSSIATLACYNNEFVDHVVAISSDMQLAFLRKYGIPAHKCHLVPGGVDIRSITRPKEPGRPLRVIFAGGDNKRYKSADLISALVQTHGQNLAGIHLDWFGHPRHQYGPVKPGGMSVSIADRLPRDEFLEKMRAADVLLFPSRYEGCPLALMEGMRAGLVPIAADGIGAMRWMIQSGVNGFVLPLTRWPSLAAGLLIHLRDNPKETLRLKLAAQERCRSSMDVRAVSAQLLELLARPTVDRSRPASSLNVLRWNRPFRNLGEKSPLPDRLAIRFGILRKEGILALD